MVGHMTTIFDAQNEVDNWVMTTFGSEVRNDVLERAFRLMEEACELVQTAGMSLEQVETVAKSVFARPVEELAYKEVAGTFTCLCALATAMKEDVDRAYLTERGYRHANIEKIRQKFLTKPRPERS
jgi:hypothetical protein